MMAKGKFKFRGGSRSVESVVRKSKQSGGNFDRLIKEDCPGFKVGDGENCIRIMPAGWDDVDKWGDGWEIPVEVHYGVGPDEQQYFCLDKMQDEACPVCEARSSAQSEEESSELKSTWRALCWIIDRDNEKAGPMLWSMPMTVFKEINLRSVDKKSNTPILIDDPEDGYDITFNKEGSGLRTKYTAFEIDRDPSPLHDDEDKQDDWLEYITENNIPDIMQFFKYDHIEKVLFGKGKSKGDEEEEEEEEAPRSSRRRRRGEDESGDEEPRSSRRRRRAQETEEEEDDGDDAQTETESEEEAEAPRKSRRRRRIKGEEESEEEQEDDDADGEEPSGGTRRRLRSMKGRKRK